jgi:Zn-finger nucleic acid-binding protein
MSSCPRCAEPLAAATYHAVEVGVCPECTGLLVEMVQLVPLLDGMVGDLGAVLDAELDIDPVDDRGENVVCPGCTGPMENFGYLGEETVRLDRCAACAVLWLDPAELGAAALLHGRTMVRVDSGTSVLEKTRRESMGRFSRLTMGRAVSERLASLLT